MMSLYGIPAIDHHNCLSLTSPIKGEHVQTHNHTYLTQQSLLVSGFTPLQQRIYAQEQDPVTLLSGLLRLDVQHFCTCAASCVPHLLVCLAVLFLRQLAADSSLGRRAVASVPSRILRPFFPSLGVAFVGCTVRIRDVFFLFFSHA